MAFNLTSPFEFTFRGATLVGEVGPDADSTWVAIKPICEHLGIAAAKQAERIQAEPEFTERYRHMVVPSAGGPQTTFCVALSRLTLWLASIQTLSVSREKQDALVLFKLECAAALTAHFFGPDRLPSAVNAVSAVLPSEGQTDLWAVIQTLAAATAEDHRRLREALEALEKYVKQTVDARVERLFTWLKDWRDQKRKEFPKQLVDYAVQIHLKYFGSNCVCCVRRPIFDGEKFIGDVDHWNGNGLDVRLGNLMLMCEACNRHDKVDDPDGFRLLHGRAFQAFQEHLFRDKTYRES